MASDSRVIFSTELDDSGLKRGLARLGSSVGTMARGMALALGAVGAGLGALAKQGVTYNSQMEQYTTSFTTMLGGAAAAEKKVAELKEFAAKTPFEMTDLADATKTILGFGVAEDRADVAMRRLGDISQGNAEKFSSLSLVYGQVASTGKLMGQDLLQMINAGFNPLQQIAEKTGASMGDLKAVMSGEKTSKEFQKMLKDAQKEVKKLGDNASPAAKMLAQIGTDGMISADMVDQAMQIATSEGGLFYQAMEKQSKTFAGQLSTLKDNANSLVGEVSEGLSTAMSDTVLPMASGYLEQLTEAFRARGAAGLTGAFGNVLGDVVGKVSAFAPQAVGMALKLLQSLVNGLRKNAGVIAKGFADTLKVAAIGMIQAVPDMISVLLTVATELVSNLADALPDIIPELIDAVFEVLTSFLSNAPKMLAIGVKMAAALVAGLVRGVGSLIGGFSDLFTAIFNGTKVNAQDVQDYVDGKCSKYVTAYTNTKTKIDELRASIDQGTELTETDYQSALTLLDTLAAMGNPKDLSGSELEQYKAIVAGIAEKWPELEKYIGKNGLFKQDTDAIREHLQALYDEKQAEYLLNKLPEAVETAGQAQKDYSDRIAAIREQNALLDAAVQKKQTLLALEDKINGIANATTMSDSDTITQTKQLLDSYVNSGGSLDDVKANLSDISSLDFTNVDSALDVLSALGTLAADPNGALETQIASIKAAIDTLTNGGTTSDGVDIPALSAVRTQTEAAQLIVADLKTQIEALTADDTETAPVKTTRSMKKSVDSDIAATGTALDTGKTTLKEKAQAAFASMQEGLTGDGTTAETDVQTAGGNLADKLADGIRSNNRPKAELTKKVADAASTASVSGNLKGYAVGANLVAGVAQGITDHGYQISDALRIAIQTAISVIKIWSWINSPSKLFARELGAPFAEGIGYGFSKMMVPVSSSMMNSIAESVQSAKSVLDGTLLSQVQGAAASGVSLPSMGSLSAAMLSGSLLATGGTAQNTTINAPQTINFYDQMQAPDEIARAIRKQNTYGLAGARV